MCMTKRTLIRRISVCAASGILGATLMVVVPAAAAAGAPQAAAQAARQVGVIKGISGNTITLGTDAGGEISVEVASNAVMVRVAPGQTDLKNAEHIQLSDLHVGDRILVRGQPSSDAKSFVATGVISMSRSDVQAQQQRDREDWQKRGIGGLVTSVDPGTGTITISVAAMGGAKTIAIHTMPSTILRRYAPDSIQFDDAKPAPIDQIKPGDQLRARGERGADGSEFAAVEVVSGSFRNIAGTIRSVDVKENVITVMDLITKKPFSVKITGQSQLRVLPPEMAQRVAFRFKGTGNAASPSQGPAGSPPASVANGGESRGGAGGGRAAGGQADLQQIVSRIPPAALTDFKKDDAVMIVATEGADTSDVTAITMLGGVEPILTAAPSPSQAMTLSPWSLGGTPGMAGDDAQ
jgi:hypothetical protein